MHFCQCADLLWIIAGEPSPVLLLIFHFALRLFLSLAWSNELDPSLAFIDISEGMLTAMSLYGVHQLECYSRIGSTDISVPE